MKSPDRNARKGYADIVFDRPSIIAVPGTKRKVKIRGIKPYTLERLTQLWLEKDGYSIPESSSDTLKDLCKEPYFAVKEAILIILNDYWKIRLFYPLMWRIWGKWIGYSDEQMFPIIEEGKKKLPLMPHWKVMAFSVDMRQDWMTMTRKEAEQYRAELLSAVSQLSLKSTPNTEGQEDSSSDS